jgi:hypothetical protein
MTNTIIIHEPTTPHRIVPSDKGHGHGMLGEYACHHLKDTMIMMKVYLKLYYKYDHKILQDLQDELNGLIDAPDEIYRLVLGFIAMESTIVILCSGSTSFP